MATASARPHRKDTRNSFQMTLKMSLNSNSPSESARMTETEAWLPELPPVSISMGTDANSTGTSFSESSKRVMTMPVNVPETISSSSHGMRFFQVSNTPVRR